MPRVHVSVSSVGRHSFPLHAHNAVPRYKLVQSSVVNVERLPPDDEKLLR